MAREIMKYIFPDTTNPYNLRNKNPFQSSNVHIVYHETETLSSNGPKPGLVRIREHLKTDKNSHIFQHINKNITCKNKCNDSCFSIIDTASTEFTLKIKEAMHIEWLKPSLNKQKTHINLSINI